MSAYSESYTSSVNRWECDENDHMNVRFYLRKSMEVLHLGLAELGLIEPEKLAQLNTSIRRQHMRFLSEAKFSTPISGRLGVIAVQNNRAEVLTELRHSVTNKVLMNIVHEIQLPSPIGKGAAQLSLIPLPGNAGPRGIAAEDSPHSGVTREELLTNGFISAGGGVIHEDECERGVMDWSVHMGRVSDLMPTLWARLTGTHNNPEESGIGRAVLEHRLTPHNSLAAGSRFEMLSALTKIQGKAQELTHFMFDLEHEKPVFCSQVMSITIDLVTRKAIALPKAYDTFLNKSLKLSKK